MDNPKIAAMMASTFLLVGVQVMAARPAYSQMPEPQANLPERPNPDQHVARIKAINARVDEYLNSLAMAVRSEKRDDAWASQYEGNLRQSFKSHVGSGGLKSIDCRATQCSVEVDMSAGQSSRPAPDQRMKVTQWISSSTTCGYTMVPGPDPTSTAASTVRIYLNCERH
jgi:hypothetical protein